MPYNLNNPPKTIQLLPHGAKIEWIKVFNLTYRTTKGTTTEKDNEARIAAWAAVKNKGYRKTKDGIWKRWQ